MMIILKIKVWRFIVVGLKCLVSVTYMVMN